MQKLTPDWDKVGNALINILDDIADDINWKQRHGEDPAITVTDALADLELIVDAIKDNPGQFNYGCGVGGC